MHELPRFSLDALSEDMLVQILKEPKNAIIKQYQKLLAMDEVKLEFDDGALRAIAKCAKEKNRGLNRSKNGRGNKHLCSFSCHVSSLLIVLRNGSRDLIIQFKSNARETWCVILVSAS